MCMKVTTKALGFLSCVEYYFKLFWSSSFETWLISTIINGKSSSIIIVDDVGKYNIDIGKTNKWITIWETICYDSLNRRYFKFSDTGTYIIK